MGKQFVYTDIVFGTHTITEPVIVDLVASPPLQRLAHIDQAGYSHPFFPHQRRHTRLEHSLGVYLLLKQYGASLEEQIAGLIHDVSHAAFSHCVDYALEDSEAGKTQAHQDNIFEEYVRRSSIPQILADHGVQVDLILDDRRFPLKEQPLPCLCADRIDYSFRSALTSNMGTPQGIHALIQNLATNGHDWFFRTQAAAQEFATLFSHLNAVLWSGLPSAAMFRTVGDCLRYACRQQYLCYQDFYGTDQSVLEKIRDHLPTDSHLQLLYDRMNTIISFAEDPLQREPPTFCKSRAVDPLCLHHGELVRLSQIDPSWAATCMKELRHKAYFLRFV